MQIKLCCIILLNFLPCRAFDALLSAYHDIAVQTHLAVCQENERAYYQECISLPIQSIRSVIHSAPDDTHHTSQPANTTIIAEPRQMPSTTSSIASPSQDSTDKNESPVPSTSLPNEEHSIQTALYRMKHNQEQQSNRLRIAQQLAGNSYYNNHIICPWCHKHTVCTNLYRHLKQHKPTATAHLPRFSQCTAACKTIMLPSKRLPLVPMLKFLKENSCTHIGPICFISKITGWQSSSSVELYAHHHELLKRMRQLKDPTIDDVLKAKKRA